MRRSRGLASDTRPPAFRGSTPVSRARMQRIVPVASFSSFSPLGRAFAQFHARLSFCARHRHRYARGALSARTWRAGFPFVRLVLPAPGCYRFVNICFFRWPWLTLILLWPLCTRSSWFLLLLLLTGFGTDQLQSGHAPRLQRVEVRLLLWRWIFLRRAQNICARGTVGFRRHVGQGFFRFFAGRFPKNEDDDVNTSVF